MQQRASPVWMSACTNFYAFLSPTRILARRVLHARPGSAFLLEMVGCLQQTTGVNSKTHLFSRPRPHFCVQNRVLSLAASRSPIPIFFCISVSRALPPTWHMWVRGNEMEGERTRWFGGWPGASQVIRVGMWTVGHRHNVLRRGFWGCGEVWSKPYRNSK
jgi:hypothetical protein